MKKILIGGGDNDYANYVLALNSCQALCEVSLKAGVFSLKTGIFSEFDGLLLPGGYDLNPCLYGEENKGSRHIDDTLDKAQLLLLDTFIRAGKPVLGICRGHQVINVYFGGTLIQHMDTASLHQQPEGDCVHETLVSRNSFLRSRYGRSRFCVNSCHHQALGRIGQGLLPIQHTADGAVEAMVHQKLPVFSVQWHPERMMLAHARTDTVDGSPIFHHFLSMTLPR